MAYTLTTLLSTLSSDDTKMGDIKKTAKEIKKDHALALELWASKDYKARLLSVLILDKKELTQETLDQMADDLNKQELDQRCYIADWLMANQLMKSKKTTQLLTTWQNHPQAILRRLFWYHQARLRWTGQTPPDNTEDLVQAIDSNLGTEAPEVQWAMNFCAGQIGIHEATYRQRCIDIGLRVGLYKDIPVPKNCTPDYLPEFIRIEVEKRH